MASLNLMNIRKEYDGVCILKDISMTVNEGELVALLGASGCGKTTILHIIAGLIDQNQGTVNLNGSSIDEVPIEQRDIALVDQKLLLFPHMTVSENIGFGLKVRRVAKKEIKAQVSELIELVELQGQENKYPSQLSGGQLQRVAIARALAIKPRILLLDEPFSKLDISLRSTLQRLLRQIQKRLKMTTILVTHDKDEALLMSDKVAMIIDGRLEQYDKPEIIYEKPVSKKVADFFGVYSYFEGRIEDQKLITPFGSGKVSAPDATVTCGILAERIKISENPEGVKVKIVDMIYTGVNFECNGIGEGKKVKFMIPSDLDVNIGETVCLNIDFDHVVYFNKENTDE